jgi:hypothetical protein
VRLVDPATGLIEREWLATLSKLASAPAPAPGAGVDLTPRVTALESKTTALEQAAMTQGNALTAVQTTATALAVRVSAVETINDAQNLRLTALEFGGYQS